MDRKQLNIGCGNNYLKDFINIDINPNIKTDLVLDVEKEKLPYEDNSIYHIQACNLLEHLHDFIPFMNECHRVLMPGQNMYVLTDDANSEGFWQDPTHVRGFLDNTFLLYFQKSKFKQFYNINTWSKVELIKQQRMWDGKEITLLHISFTK